MKPILSLILIVIIAALCIGCGSAHSLATSAPEAEQNSEAILKEGVETMHTYSYSTREIWVHNGGLRIYGIAYIPDAGGKLPLVVFSHELGNDHTSGVRYAERLAAAGYASYVFDFCGGTVGGNKSDGSNKEMSVLTEASDLEAVLASAKTWDFVDADRIVLLGGSMGGLVTTVVGCTHQDEIAGMILLYPALSAKVDGGMERYPTKDDVPEDVSLFGGWIHVGRNYITDKRVANVHTRNGMTQRAVWYQFTIPLNQYQKKVGSIQDFSNIRFMRIFMTGFKGITHLRFATLELTPGD